MALFLVGYAVMQIFPCENSLRKAQETDSMAFCGVNVASRCCSSHLLHINVVCVPVSPGGQVAMSVEFCSLSLNISLSK